MRSDARIRRSLKITVSFGVAQADLFRTSSFTIGIGIYEIAGLCILELLSGNEVMGLLMPGFYPLTSLITDDKARLS
jgi:hypothetical protein